jgi:hypothetical protein
MKFMRDGDVKFTATVNSNNVGYLNGDTLSHPDSDSDSMITANTSTCTMDRALWHRRLGHINHDTVNQMVKQNLVLGMDIVSQSKPDPICERCLHGKQHRRNIPRGPSAMRTRVLALIHTDLKGPLSTEGFTSSGRGYKYWITFICDALRFWTVDFLKRKSDAFASFVRFKAYAENFHGIKIQATRDDGGGEYMGKVFNDFCDKEGIDRQRTEPDEPHQNGVVERANRIIAEGAGAMLSEANLPPSFWPLAASAFVHVRNRCPNSRQPTTTPYTVKHRSFGHRYIFFSLQRIKSTRGFQFHSHAEARVLIPIYVKEGVVGLCSSKPRREAKLGYRKQQAPLLRTGLLYTP